MSAGAPSPRGPFITFEGGDGVGKSTQLAMFAERLRAEGRDVLTTREPGGSPGAEAIRALLVEETGADWSPLAETLLVCAARADHLEKTIAPALAAGRIVLCDRFADSTMAYQHFGGGAPREAVDAIHRAAVGALDPDLALIFDLDEETALERAASRGGAARFEGKGADFQRRVRDGFRRIARENPRRCRVIDAAGPADKVAERAWTAAREAGVLG